MIEKELCERSKCARINYLIEMNHIVFDYINFNKDKARRRGIIKAVRMATDRFFKNRKIGENRNDIH